ncbi:uncharacterized protein Z520_01157 [Fonsecaea multimorphosa CBS 102226]|uniref:Uncharacterized protein n=1 Tax=Fonsecaea multimorphosa CBS 102226 TaxID=1442371 RepID=A0A0D2J001_9EURO|nr:uncharacterized protein Z520_01157 [Fonsecaea multimorphosa CBS 102226]KIY02692.1 hypothetical protein Z520_01157 [Fonsecaea multimorphosa CBS 102226]OAL31554.1 hypothetical protein AYO22_01146 [Fonsecaea multimorphosa]
MSDPTNVEHKFRHGTSTRSNTSSIHFSEPCTVRETSQTLRAVNGVQPRPMKPDLGANNRQEEATRDRRTRDWVHGCHGYSPVGDQGRQRWDSINQQLRAADELAGELSKFKTTDGESKSDNPAKSETSCQSLQFVGAWTDEKDMRN